MPGAGYNRSVVTDIIRDTIAQLPRGASSRIAEQLGVKPQTVSKWVNGQTTPDMAEWPRIEDALGLPAGTLRAAAFGEPATPMSTAEAAEIRDRLTRIESMLEEVLRRSPKGSNNPSGPARN